MPCRLLIDLQVVDLLQTLPPGRRRKLVNQFGAIQRYPAAHSDYVDTDSQGRRVDVSVTDGFAIYYWIDEADQQVKVLELIVADQSKRS